MSDQNYFPDVTLLITHYNRSSSLERLLTTFRDLKMKFKEIIVSDDGSKAENINKIKNLQSSFTFTLITTPQNKGLGNNINKGLQKTDSPLILYVQEDFYPQPEFKKAFNDALSILKERDDLDIARFYAYFKYPFLKPIRDGFSEMNFGLWKKGYRKFYMYSDHPHLRRNNFTEKFGKYHEGIKGDATEYNMMMSFLQKKGKGIFYDNFKQLFTQYNPQDEPSTMTRDKLRNSENLFISLIRDLYRHLKFNMDYHFKKL